MTKYIHIINFAKNNAILYFIILNFFIFVIFSSLIFFIIIAIKINKQDMKSFWPIYILQLIIPSVSSSFFSQIFFTLLTTFSCDENNKESFFSSSYKCLQGLWFDIQAPLSIISIIFLFLMSYITNSIFYNPMCLKAKNKKYHSLTDVVFLFTKIVMNIVFIFYKYQMIIILYY